MTLEGMKEEFEEKFCKYLDFPENSLPMIRSELYTNFEPIIDWIEIKIDEACKKQREICADNMYNYTFFKESLDEQQKQLIQDACYTAPSPKESE